MFFLLSFLSPPPYILGGAAAPFPSLSLSPHRAPPPNLLAAASFHAHLWGEAAAAAALLPLLCCLLAPLPPCAYANTSKAKIPMPSNKSSRASSQVQHDLMLK